MLTTGFRWAPETRAREQDDGRDHQGRRDDQGAIGHGRPAEAGVDHAAADGHEHQEERPEHLGEQPPSLVAAVPEVELVQHRVGRAG
jgi:hypothetical protein